MHMILLRILKAQLIEESASETLVEVEGLWLTTTPFGPDVAMAQLYGACWSVSVAVEMVLLRL